MIHSCASMRGSRQVDATTAVQRIGQQRGGALDGADFERTLNIKLFSLFQTTQTKYPQSHESCWLRGL